MEVIYFNLYTIPKGPKRQSANKAEDLHNTINNREDVLSCNLKVSRGKITAVLIEE